MKRSVLAAALLACSVPVTAPVQNDAGAPVETTVVKALRLERTAVHEGATIALATAGGKELALVSDDDGSAVRVIDLVAKKELSSVGLRKPAQLLVLADGGVAVAAEDALVLFEMHDDFRLAETARFATAHDPRAIASALDDSVVYVASDARRVQGFRMDGTEVMHADTREMPRALAVTNDGHVLVAHAAASDVLTLDAKTGAATSASLDFTLLDVAPIGQVQQTKDEDGHVSWIFANGMGTNWARMGRSQVTTHARHAYAFARAGSRLFVAHDQLLPNVTHGESGVDVDAAGGYGGAAELGSVFFSVAERDARTGANADFHATMGECSLPRGAAWDAATETLFVACSGDDWVVPMRRFDGISGAPGEMIRPIEGPKYAAMVRIKTCAGPDSIALDRAHDRVVVSCSRDAAITVAKLSKALAPDPERIAFSRTRPDDAITRGRDLFYRGNDGRIASDGRACATCHVEGMTDGLVWSTPRGMRNPPSLAGRASHASFGWNGQSASLADHVTSTIRTNLAGRGLPANDVADLAAYVASIPAPPGTIDSRAERGKELFVARDCAICHTSGGSDHARHDVRSGGKFETPSLVGLAHSTPYFHDGRYATLEELLEKTRGSMGSNEELGVDDRDALAAYLRTL